MIYYLFSLNQERQRAVNKQYILRLFSIAITSIYVHVIWLCYYGINMQDMGYYVTKLRWYMQLVELNFPHITNYLYMNHTYFHRGIYKQFEHAQQHVQIETELLIQVLFPKLPHMYMTV